MTERKYDVALSFAGEERAIAKRLAEALRAREVRVFFDEFVTAEMWGKNLYEYLSDVYLRQARLCVMLVSGAYAAKAWTNHERRSAQARVLEQNPDYLLPIRIDDAEVPGLLPTVAYLSYDDYSIDEIADIVVMKIASDGEPGPCLVPTKGGAEHFASLGAVIPEPEVGLPLGKQKLLFHSESGKVVECRGTGDEQEIWIVSDGREVGHNMPDRMLRVRKGHFVSWMKVAPRQPFPEFLVAAINYSTRRLTISSDEVRFLAAASIVGTEKAPQALLRAGKFAFARAFGIAFMALILAILLTDSQSIQYTAFLVVLLLAVLEPFIQHAGIEARSRELVNFLASRYGSETPADLTE